MQQRIHRLDTLRAAAISMVFLAHTVLGYGPTFLLKPLQTGGIGVDLFFALSGWLIGSQLFKEIGRSGTIDVKRFLIRRWMRTLPAYYVVLTLTLIQLSITKNDFVIPFEYFIFTQNYYGPLTFFSISWSLCVEEQFYLFIAPFMFALKNARRELIFVFLIFLLLAPSVFRSLGMFDSYIETHVSWDCCIMGVTLAFIHQRYPTIWTKLQDYNKLILPAATMILIVVIFSKYTENFHLTTPSKLTLACIFGAWIVWANSEVTKQSDSSNTFVSISKYIASRSYSIYLLHPEALALTSRFISDSSYPVYFIIASVISLLMAEVLFKLIEIPFMNIRESFAFSRAAKYK